MSRLEVEAMLNFDGNGLFIYYYPTLPCGLVAGISYAAVLNSFDNQ